MNIGVIAMNNLFWVIQRKKGMDEKREKGMKNGRKRKWKKKKMGMKKRKYSTFPKASGLQPHHQMQFNVILETLLPLCRGVVGIFFCSRPFFFFFFFLGDNHLFAVIQIICSFMISNIPIKYQWFAQFYGFK